MQVVQNEVKSVRKITKRDNQLRGSTFGADILKYAKKKIESETGCIYMVHAHEPSLITLAGEYEKTLANKDSVRECMLAHWYKTPEGVKFKKQRDAIPRGNKRSDVQVTLANTLTKIENAVNNQMIRALDTYYGVKILRDQQRLVHIERIEGTETYSCYVRAQAVLKEQTNTIFTAQALQLAKKVSKAFTDRTPTKKVFEICNKANGKATQPNKKKGGALEALPPPLIGRTARQMDTALSPLAMKGKIEGVGKGSRLDIHALWARIDQAMSEEEKDAARVAFNALAAKPTRKAKKVA